MHSSYTSSTLFPFRKKGSVSISFNDNTNCCSCCCCFCSCGSSLYTRKVAVNPSILYGLRQSSLIQCSPGRRFVLGGGNGCYSYSDYEVSSSFRARRSSGGKVRCTSFKETSSRYWLSGVADVEDVLSLLSDQVDDKWLGATESYRRLSPRVGGEKRRDYAIDCFRQRRRRAEVKKQSDFNSERYGGKKKTVEVEERSGCDVHHQAKEKKDVSGCLENVSEHEVRSVTINFEKEGHGRTEERESLRKNDNHERRTKSSSCSSYYSLSSTGDFESDAETLEKADQFLEKPFAEKEKDSVRREESRIEGRVEQRCVEDAGGEERYNAVGSGCHWDLRKKSEKKLYKVGTEEMKSTKKSLEAHSRIEKAYDTEHVKESGYSEQYAGNGDYSNYAVNSSQSTRQENVHVTNEVSQRSESHRDISKVSKQSETQMKQQHVSEKSGSWSQSNFGARNEMKDARTNYNMVSKTTMILDDGTERFASQRNSESQLKRHEEKEQHQLLESKAHQTKEFSVGSQEMTNVSVIHSAEVDNAVRSHQSIEKGMFERENNLIRDTKLVGETSHGYQEISEIVMEMKSGKGSSKSGGVRKSRENADGSSSTQVSMVSQSTEQQTGKVEAEKRSTHAILMPPPSQLIGSGLVDEKMVRITAQEASSTTSESSSSTKYLTSGGRTSSDFHESSRENRGDRLVEPFKDPSPEDSLGSAHRLEESSIQFVGEFIERVRHEVSTSEIQKEMKSSVDEIDMHEHESTNQFVKESSQRKRNQSRQISDGSRARGPSEEVWDVTQTSAEEPREADIPEASPTGEQAVVKRSGRSLWNIMVDIVRLRWGSHATSSSSAARSGGRTPANESAESEAWFSGREIDETSEENQKGERTNVPQDSISHHLEHGRTSDQLGVEVSGLTRVATNKKELEKKDSLSSHVSEMSLKDNYSVHVEVNQGTIGIPGGKVVTESSAPLASSCVRPAPIVGDVARIDEMGATISGSMESKDKLQGASLVEVSPGSQAKGGGLRPRKLERTKQVLRDRFDEWEEAHKLETEQRKVDEMFMKEALMEAKKAADIWEVPVGAVLVQHGKIIARGCNLVEELRDSTAHAEMICIREASNQLQSWRLAGTTLYVTLEPCPMCAGAILQARIDTLVWGAPNKLLGADGSWIRLFPDGEGGDNSDQTVKPAPPVHPFHPNMKIRRGVLASDCSDVMQQFFQLRRKKKKEVEKSPLPSCLPVPSHPSKLLNRMHGIFHAMFCL